MDQVFKEKIKDEDVKDLMTLFSELRDRLDRYDSALNRRVDNNQDEIEGIGTDLKAGLIRIKDRIDQRVFQLDKKLDYLNASIEKIGNAAHKKGDF